jgi:hypothetical protein
MLSELKNKKELCSNLNKIEHSIGTSTNQSGNLQLENSFKLSHNGTKFVINTISIHLEKYLTIMCNHHKEQSLKHSEDKNSQVNIFILKYFYPAILVFGLLGNLVSLIIMINICKNKKKPRFRFSLNLAALSLADLAVLIFGCFREYSDDILEIRLRSMNVFMCKFIYFNCYLFSCFSAYLHVFISIERWYAVSRPIKSKTNPLKNKKIIFIIFSMCVFISSPYIYFAQIKDSSASNTKYPSNIQSSDLCEISQSSVLSILILALNDYIICCIIPFICALTFSSLTLISLCRNKNNHQTDVLINNHRKSSKTDSLGQSFGLKKNRIDLPQIMEISKNRLKNEPNSRSKVSLRKNSTQTSIKLRKNSSSYASLKYIPRHSEIQIINSISSSNVKLTVMLMSLPICFIITNCPIFIIIILQFYPFKSHTKEYKFELAISRVLMYINNSIHILFYIFLGNTLRKDFKRFLKNFLNHKSH